MSASHTPAVDVLVVGDANPDLLLTGDTVPRFGQAEQLLDAAELVLGGSAAIVACGLARLGMRTALVSVVGRDGFGDVVLHRLEERGVDVSAIVERGDVPTGLSVVLAQPGDRAILTLPGTIPLLDAATVRAAVERLRPRHVHIASYFLQPSLAAELPSLLGWLGDRAVTTSLDTNWDPAERWDGLSEVLPSLTVFLPNDEEARAIAGSIADRPVDSLDDAGAILSALGCRVVVKAGAEGGIAYEDAARTAGAPGLVLDVVDTTGAGDSFDAGYLAAMLSGVGTEEGRLRWAATAGSLSVRGIGGTAEQATEAELSTALV
ncbi:carbohydrate kinase family protein [Leifsonia sp. NPDC058292]|uniref:carbohydrate kinase family protein n=1 Tax=Leifsonia sp. NPDC058292 TaxID=3346428 RepID=UPI0036DD1079